MYLIKKKYKQKEMGGIYFDLLPILVKVPQFNLMVLPFRASLS